MLYRGTTPYHSFILPLSVEDISAIYITYMQNNKIIVEKTINDIELHNVDTIESGIVDTNTGDSIDSNNVTIDGLDEITTACSAIVHLTQEDTLGFTFWPAAEKNIAVIQIRVLTSDNEAYTSEPINERIYGVLKDGVI